MTTAAHIGQTFTFTALNDDASGNVDPVAIDSWQEVDAFGAAVSSGFIGPLAPSGNTATALATGSGSGFVAATASDPDGNAVTSAPFPWTVLAASDTSVVTVSATVA